MPHALRDADPVSTRLCVLSLPSTLTSTKPTNRHAPMKLASRLDHIEPFYVMECAKAAVELARSPECDPRVGGEAMIFLNIGEPDFTAPPLVQEAAERAMRQGRTQYTDATGLPAL